MAIHMKQSLALKQTLRMTPQLQQAIKLLQLSRLELETAIRKELTDNPILEENADTPSTEMETPREAAEKAEASSPDASETNAETNHNEAFEWESYFDHQNRTRERSTHDSDEIMNYENVLSQSQSLHDHLQWQASMYGFNEEELTIASQIINYIDDDGYLKTPLHEIASEIKVEVAEVEDILKFVQEFDPAGVGARDLKECLLIQAKHLQEDTNDVLHLINNHLTNLEKKNYPAIAKEMQITVPEVIEMCKIINIMEPKPGRAWAPNDTHYVTPDVYVVKVGDEFIVSLNEDGLPKLKISNFYKNMLKEKEVKGEAQDYIQDKLRSALWLIKSIHQRQRTIYKVAESIVRHQKDFFEKGPAFIKPMILRDVANDIEMHESTVSRVTTAKYMHTPQGIFELKYFFNSGINTSDGDALASESVKVKIKALVSAEDPKRPLSDQKIVELLKKDGLDIARRTVAKYRDVLKILPSSKRKKMF